jgi:hypothetical protein
VQYVLINVYRFMRRIFGLREMAVKFRVPLKAGEFTD